MSKPAPVYTFFAKVLGATSDERAHHADRHLVHVKARAHRRFKSRQPNAHALTSSQFSKHFDPEVNLRSEMRKLHQLGIYFRRAFTWRDGHQQSERLTPEHRTRLFRNALVEGPRKHDNIHFVLKERTQARNVVNLSNAAGCSR